MQLCSDSHQEVCYDGRKCPVCDAIADKNSDIDELNKKIKELESNAE
jgi:hypothetical protein